MVSYFCLEAGSSVFRPKKPTVDQGEFNNSHPVSDVLFLSKATA